MRRIIFLLFSLYFSFGLKAQDSVLGSRNQVAGEGKQLPKFTTVPELSDWIISNYKSDKERLWVAFSWVANTISYDIASLSRPQQEVPLRDAIDKAFRTKRAVCEGYAGLMDSLSKLMGIPSATISGYTRNNGNLDPTPHMWIASFVDGQWQLSDPTWASGSIVNKRFKATFDSSYFLRPASLMLQTHMPYDPIWQLVDEPLSHRGFITGDETLKTAVLDYEAEISYFLNSPDLERYMAEWKRIKYQNIRHQALNYRLEYLEKSIQIEEHNTFLGSLREVNSLYNQAVQKYNQAVEMYNKNKSLNEVSLLIQQAEALLSEAKLTFNDLLEAPESLVKEKQRVGIAITEFQKQLRNFVKH